MNNGKIFLDIAKQDLEAAKILYERKFYPQAVFFLQQSIEKAAKSFFIEIGMVKEEKLETFIRHNPLKIITLLAKKEKEFQQEQQKLIKENPELTDSFLYKAETNELSEIKLIKLEELKKLSKEINNSPDKIRENLNNLKLLRNQIITIISYQKNVDVKEMIGKENLEEITRIFKILNEKQPLDKKYTKFTNQDDIAILLRHIKHNTHIIFYLFISLSILSLITLIGATESRYPDTEKGTRPQDIFNSKSPIIKDFASLAEIQESNLAALEGLQYNLGVARKLFNT